MTKNLAANIRLRWKQRAYDIPCEHLNLELERNGHGEALAKYVCTLCGEISRGAFSHIDSDYTDKESDVMTVVKVSLGVALVVLTVGIALAVSKDVQELIDYTREPTFIPPKV